MGIEIKDKAQEDFSKYSTLLVKYNKVMNLTAITDSKEIEIKHFLDSLTPIKTGLIENGMKIADVGTGAGFPGIPIKIAKRDISLTLIDSLEKRVNFLKTVCRELDLDKTDCIHKRAEEAGHDDGLRESFDVVLSRAVAPLSVILEYCLPLASVGGHVLLLKGPTVYDEASACRGAAELLGGKIEKIEDFTLPGDICHSIVIVKKISQTPTKYPRKPGKPSKSPLK